VDVECISYCEESTRIEKGSLYLASGEMLKVGSQKVFLVLWHLAMSNFICFNSFFILDLTKSHHFQFRSMNNSCYSIATGNDSVNNAFSNSQIFSQLELIVEGLDENLRTDDEVEKKSQNCAICREEN
jgi:hypothetical protein